MVAVEGADEASSITSQHGVNWPVLPFARLLWPLTGHSPYLLEKLRKIGKMDKKTGIGFDSKYIWYICFFSLVSVYLDICYKTDSLDPLTEDIILLQFYFITVMMPLWRQSLHIWELEKKCITRVWAVINLY